MFRSFLVVVLIFFSFSGYSQRWKLTRYEGILGIGTTSYFGDIGGSASRNNWFGLKDVQLLATRPSIYFGARYKLDYNQAIKFNIVWGWLSGTDKNSVNAWRGYSFNTLISEQTIQYEYSLIAEDRRRFSYAFFSRHGMANNYSKINFYGLIGAGGLFYNPKFNGNLVDPKNEIVNNSPGYTLVGFGGLGIKLIYDHQYAFGFEFGGRYAFSDYLDGFTTKFSHHNDVYYFGVFNLVYRIKTSRRGYPILFKRF